MHLAGTYGQLGLEYVPTESNSFISKVSMIEEGSGSA